MSPETRIAGRRLWSFSLFLALWFSAQATAQDGSIVAWGFDESGETIVPEPNSNFVAIETEDYTSYGLKNDGSIVVWGDCPHVSGVCNVPTPNSGFIAISASFQGSERHVLGLKSDGSIVAWGSNGDGQCNVPAPNSGFIGVCAGEGLSVGIKSDGSLVIWGYCYNCEIPEPNGGFVAVSYAQVGFIALRQDGSVVHVGEYPSSVPLPQPNTDFVAIHAADDVYMGLKSNGSIVTWGNCSTSDLCVVPEPNSGFVAISGGSYVGMALRDDGSVVTWGAGCPPVICEIPTPNIGFVAVSCDVLHALALRPYVVNTVWNEPFGGLFHDAANWTAGAPDQYANVTFDSNAPGFGPNYTVTVGSDANCKTLRVTSQREVLLTLLSTPNLTTFENDPDNPPAIIVGDLPNPDFSRLTLRHNGSSLRGLSGPVASLGHSPASKGMVNVQGQSGSQTSFTCTQELMVGNQGTGVLNVLGHTNNVAKATVTGEMNIAKAAGSSGTVLLNGAGASMTFSGSEFTVGNSGTASLTIQNGANLNTSTVSQLVLGKEAGSSANVLITGANSKWTEQVTQMFVAGAGSASLAICNGGSLEFPNVSVLPNGIISGNGTLLGDVLNFGQISPGCVGGSMDGAPVAGIMTINGAYRQIGPQPNNTQNSGTLVLEIGGNQPGVNQDRLVVNGTAELGGGLFIDLTPGFQPTGGSFDVLAATSTTRSFEVAYLPALDGKFIKVNYPSSATDGPGGSITLTVQDLSSILGFNSLEPPLPGSPTAGVVGDFNGDSLDDLAITITNGPAQSGDLLVFLSAGGGAFQTAQQYQVGAQPSAITVGRFNAGGSLDIAVTNREDGVGPGTAMVFANSGTGSLFSSLGAPITVGVNPSSIAAGDFHTIGADDLLVANTGSNTVSLIQIVGTGLTPLVTDIPVPTGPIIVTPADIDNPRDLGFIVASGIESSVTVFKNSGGGVFLPSQSASYPVGADPRALHVVDLNQDGHVDVVTANLAGDATPGGGGTVSVLVNTGADGGLSPSVNLPLDGGAAYSIVSANLDHPIDPQPGDPDLVDLAVLVDNGVGGSEIRILRNDTTTATVALTLLDEINTAPEGSIALVTGDLDGVNGPDLVAINGAANPLLGPSGGSADQRSHGSGTDGPPPQPSLRVLLNDAGKPRPVCRADVAPVGSLDGTVGVPDLLFIINNWGPCVNPRNCPADVAPAGPPIGDDTVSVLDLLYIINNWGPCP